ncbi:MAG: alkaline phosphatase family protein [Nocardioides sp.]
MRLSRSRALGGAAATALVAGGLMAATLGSPAAAQHPIGHRQVGHGSGGHGGRHGHRPGTTATPIKHLVVIFGENVSYDHYFGTYPKAANTDGQPFFPDRRTPRNDNLVTSGLLTGNPNLYDPQRLSPAQAMTCDQNHGYGPEQAAFDNGAMDMFVQKVSVDTCTGGLYGAPGLAMDYYDGNTVTALWNYAQHYAMSDRSFGTTFGPSSPGAINLVSAQTHGFIEVDPVTLQQVPTPGSYVLASPDADGVGTVVNDPDPAYDDCSDKNHTSSNTLAAAAPGQKNIGDLLNRRGVTWGWFQGGFRPTTPAGNGTTYAVCGATHTNVGGASVADYSPHHNPFEYYKSTSNPHHLPPTSVAMIGKTDRANHQYDLSDFDTALQTGHMPAVSFLKAGEYQDGHAGYSDPLDEQRFLVREINRIQASPEWRSTAIVIAYDDSDGWYDHVDPGVTNGSHDPAHDEAICTTSPWSPVGGYQDRCGPGPRLPLLVISRYSKTDYIDHHTTEQASILKFIEDNWQTGTIGDSSFDERAGSLDPMFAFHGHHAHSTHNGDDRLLLNRNGTVRQGG